MRVVITLDNYLDFYNLTRTAKKKTVRLDLNLRLTQVALPPLDPKVTVKAIVDNTIFVHIIKVPDFPKTNVETSGLYFTMPIDCDALIRKAYKNYLFSIYDELKASGYVAGNIELMQERGVE